jgi:flagellar protein FlaG
MGDMEVIMRIDSRDAQILTAAKFREFSEMFRNTREETVEKNNMQQVAGSQQDDLRVSESMVAESVEKANKELEYFNRRLEYSIHEGTKEIMVKVINSETNEVIREIPPEKILDMIAKLWKLVGLMVDERR